MKLSATELKRKAVHVGMGIFALLLRRLDWREAALAATAALAFNLFVLPKAGGGALLRARDVERGFPVGILLYPVVVLLLVLLFRARLEIAAAGWGFLAFGDGLATLCGQAMGRAKLPWNREKSWVGLAAYALFGGVAAACLYGFVSGRFPAAAELVILFAAAAIGAGVESLPSELDDNLVAPLVAAGALAALLPTASRWAFASSPDWLKRAAFGLLVNLIVALAAGALKIVRPSGAAAGFVFGALIYTFGGPELYGLLWIFFALGTVATRFGKKRKEAMGKAEEAGGRRGAAHVFANVAVPVFFAVAAAAREPAGAAAFSLAAAAALATALMDTVGTEVGQAVTSPTVLLPDFRRVVPGTEGAVSVAGTLAGLFAAAFLAAAALDFGLVSRAGALIVVVAAAAGTAVESFLGRAGAPWRVSNGHVLNFYNTLAGALAALALGRG